MQTEQQVQRWAGGGWGGGRRRGTSCGKGIDGGIAQQEHRIRRRVGCSRQVGASIREGLRSYLRPLSFILDAMEILYLKVGK